MAKTKWRSYWFSFEVAVESPDDVDDDEAAEDAAEFATSVGYRKGMCTVVRVQEHGLLQPTTRKQQEIIRRSVTMNSEKPKVAKAKKEKLKAKPKPKAKRI